MPEAEQEEARRAPPKRAQERERRSGRLRALARHRREVIEHASAVHDGLFRQRLRQ